MDAKGSRLGVVMALLGFIGGYITALVQLGARYQTHERRSTRIIAALHALLQTDARGGVDDDEATR